MEKITSIKLVDWRKTMLNKLKNIKLKSLSMKHFKGIENYSITFDGQSTDIYGDNDAGKTSIYDAFLWVLFHKNSKEETHFKWKPLDSNNNDIEGLHTYVKLVLSVDGVDMEFEKQKISKQVMKRKLEKMVYEDTTKYLVNGLETTTKTIYDEKVAEVLDQELFRNLTSITYFSEQLSPKERREALFSYFGTLTDTEIILKHEVLKPLIGIIGDLTVDEARRKVQQEAKQINETLKNIPLKIEGIQAAMPEISEMDQVALQEERTSLNAKKSTLLDQLQVIRSGGATGEYRSQLRLKEAELQEAKISYENQQNAKTSGIEQGKAQLFVEINELKHQVSDREFELEKLAREQESNKAYKIRLEKENELIRKRMDELFSVEFCTQEYKAIPFNESSLACAYCGTEYLEEKKDELRRHHEEEEAKRLKEFNEKQAYAKKQYEDDRERRLDEMRSRGQENAREIEQLDEAISELNHQMTDKTQFDTTVLKEKIQTLEKEMAVVIQQIDKLQAEKIPFTQTKKHDDIMNDIDFLKKSIADSEGNLEEQINVQQAKVNAVDVEIHLIDEKLAMFNEYNRQLTVIETFNEQERTFSQRKGELLEQLALFEEFYITKRDLLQDQINSHFSLVTWKLFDFYEEGGLDESVCEPMINGVSFRSLNTGSRMQAGLDVANTLMKQEGYLVPIFIDNAEAMTGHKREEVQIDTQVIALYVNEADKNLRVVKSNAA